MFPYRNFGGYGAIHKLPSNDDKDHTSVQIRVRDPLVDDLIVIVSVVVFFIALDIFAGLDIGEMFLAMAQFVRQYDYLGLDDVFGLYVFVSIGVIIFSLHRMQDLAREVRARRAAEQIAHNLARHDPLTGLPNRRFFSEKLDHALEVRGR